MGSKEGDGWQVRHTQLILLFLARLIQSMMRMCMGPLVVYVCEDEFMVCDASSKGSLLSAFSLGYLMTQIPGGYVSDLVGPRVVVAACALLAGGLTYAGGSATTINRLWLLQVVMGMAQGPLFPTSISHLARWLPKEERALASTVLDAGITAGSLVVLPFSGTLAAAIGWRTTLRAYGALAMLFGGGWWSFAQSSPEECSHISPGELELLQRSLGTRLKSKERPTPCSPGGIYSPGAKGLGPSRGVPDASESSKSGGIGVYLRLLTFKSLWSIFISHAAFNFGVYFLTSWQPTYYMEVLDVKPEAAAFAFAVPPAVNLAVKVFVNPRFERALRRSGKTTLQCRRAFSGLGFLGSTLALVPLALFSAPSQTTTTLCWTMALGCVSLHPSGFKANYMDVATPMFTGFVSGFGNTVGSTASLLSPLLVDLILRKHNSWPAVFGLVLAFNTIACALFTTSSTASPVDVERSYAD